MLFVASLLLCCKAKSTGRFNDEYIDSLIESANSIIKHKDQIDNIDSLYVIAEILDTSKREDIRAYAFKYKGIYYIFNEQSSDAIICNDIALRLFERYHNYYEMANVLSNQGVLYLNNDMLGEAIDYFFQAEMIREEYLNSKDLETVYLNLGEIYIKLQNYEFAYDYLKKSLYHSRNNSNNMFEISSLIHLIPIANALGLYDKALEYAKSGEALAIEMNNPYYLGTIYSNLSKVYFENRDYSNSIKYINDALNLSINLQTHDENINIYNNLAHAYIMKKDYESAKQYVDKSLELALKHDIDLATITNLNVITDFYIGIKNYELATYYSRMALESFMQNYQKEIHNQIAEAQLKHETERKDNEIKSLKQLSEIDKFKANQQRMLLAIALMLLISVSVIMLFVYRAYVYRKKVGDISTREREWSDELLHNILPDNVVDELKITGQFVPEVYKNCAVLFADIVNFTMICETLDPKIMIDELNDIFTSFDIILEKYNCERVKTSGDCYIGVCGLGHGNDNNCIRALQAVIDMRDFLLNRNKEKTQIITMKKNMLNWKMRFGIHVGDVIGGVVGVKKSFFDIFGDTVNTAERIKAIAEPMEIVISESFYFRIINKELFAYKGTFLLKGKGECSIYGYK